MKQWCALYVSLYSYSYEVLQLHLLNQYRPTVPTQASPQIWKFFVKVSPSEINASRNMNLLLYIYYVSHLHKCLCMVWQLCCLSVCEISWWYNSCIRFLYWKLRKNIHFALILQKASHMASYDRCFVIMFEKIDLVTMWSLCCIKSISLMSVIRYN